MKLIQRNYPKNSWTTLYRISNLNHESRMNQVKYSAFECVFVELREHEDDISHFCSGRQNSEAGIDRDQGAN